jgi:Na+/proline symporter
MNKLTVLSNLDWAIVAIVLGATLAVSLLIKDKEGKGGVEEFFTANRSAKWWLIGTSIAATTFASDTPLLITGWVAQYGIAGNWFWWGGAVGIVAITIFFARVWRSTGVVTDAEIAELRYGGKPAMILRSSKAFVFSVVVNCIILGWVLAGMSKIAEPFMDWEYLLGASVYQAVNAAYPASLIFNDLNTSITIFSLVIITLLYSALGGLRAILITDVIWFVLAMSMAIILSYFAVSSIGGLESMWVALEETYPKHMTATDLDGKVFLNHEQISSFIPSFSDDLAGGLGIPFSAFILTLTFMWWTNGNVDGAGFFAQRLYSAKNSVEAEKGALWYGIAHFVFRSWPWVIAGVAALVIYPRAAVNDVAADFNACLKDSTTCSVAMNQCLNDRYNCAIKEYGLLYKTEIVKDGAAPVTEFREDRERGYPAMIKDVMPKGLLGLALVALMGAFMSTVSTHINWGASYIANDFYLRFLNPSASNKRLLLVSRLATLGITLVAIVVASFIKSIGEMWTLYLGMMAGLGLPHLMRWFWWRANAWTEIAGMATGLVLALTNYLLAFNNLLPEGQISIFPTSVASHPIHVICWISISSALASIIATYLTPAVDDESLKEFVAKVKPIGFWRDLNKGYSAPRSFAESMIYFVLGSIGIYAGMFGFGYFLRLEYLLGSGLLTVFLILMFIVIKGMNRISEQK